MALSPNGRFIALVSNVIDGQSMTRVLHYVDTKNGERSPTQSEMSESNVVRSLDWIDDRRVLLDVLTTFEASSGVPGRYRLVKHDMRTDDTVFIEGRNPGRTFGGEVWLSSLCGYGAENGFSVHLYAASDDHILVQRRPYNWYDFRADLDNGAVRVVERGLIDKHMLWTMRDLQGRTRLAVSMRDGVVGLLHRDTGNTKRFPGGERIFDFEPHGPDVVWPLGFDEDPNALFVLARHDGGVGVFAVDLGDAGRPRRLVLPAVDAGFAARLFTLRKDARPLGVSVGAAAPVQYWDEGHARLQAAMDRALPHTLNRFVEFSSDGRRYLLFASSSIDPGVYYLGDRDAGTLDEIAVRMPGVDPAQLAARVEVHFQTRDGRPRTGYLTRPAGAADGALPAIVIPLGGPPEAGLHGFDPWAQILASAGYVVLQTHFRPHANAGVEFLHNGLADFAAAPDDEVTSATRWLIENGHADPGRICLLGRGNGGWAALLEAAREGDRYRCVATYAAFTDLFGHIDGQRPSMTHEEFMRMSESNNASLKSRSPLHLAARIDVPVYLANGTRDTVIARSHTSTMARALEKADKVVTHHALQGAGHALHNPGHRRAFFASVLAFFEAHLARQPPP